jgi:hypothetical protein
VTIDEVFSCSKGRVNLDLARHGDRSVDTCPNIAACRGGWARVDLGRYHSGCWTISGGGDRGDGWDVSLTTAGGACSCSCWWYLESLVGRVSLLIRKTTTTI